MSVLFANANGVSSGGTGRKLRSAAHRLAEDDSTRSANSGSRVRIRIRIDRSAALLYR
jgi:hypothetical protein